MMSKQLYIMWAVFTSIVMFLLIAMYAIGYDYGTQVGEIKGINFVLERLEFKEVK